MEEISHKLSALLKNHPRALSILNSSSVSKQLRVDLEMSNEFYYPLLAFDNNSVLNWEDVEAFFRYQTNGSYPYIPLSRDLDLDCHPFGGVYEVVHLYYLPSMIFVGLVGNLLSCVVFLNTHLKMRSSSYYLAALACADFGFLASLFLVWLNSTLEIPVFNIEGYCQCIVYVSSVCGFLSVWLIVAFTVERFIAVQYPLRRPHMCTVARAKAIVLYLVCISVLAHSYVFVTSGIIQMNDGSQVCEMLEGHHETMRIINIVDSLLTLIVPLVLIVVMNTMITVNLLKFSKKFKRPGGDAEKLSRDKSEINLQVTGPVSLIFYMPIFILGHVFISILHTPDATVTIDTKCGKERNLRVSTLYNS